MKRLKLWGGQVTPRALKILIAAKYTGVNLEIPPFEPGVTNRSLPYLSMNPFGQYPVLETPDGAIFESNAIMRYGRKHFDQQSSKS
eukprot:c16587_g1_i2 orf=110-367(-)